MLKRLQLLAVALVMMITSVHAQNEIRISNADLPVGQDFFWTSNNTYILNDMVFVKPGSRLFIEPGTVIKGELGRGNDATGLVVTRGAQIFAEGTSNNPIIFTSVVDELNGNLGSADRGLWGGVVVLGAARTNNPSEGGLRLIEGVNEIANPVIYAEYGGQNDDDNSGILRYVSIRHTGINVGDVAGNEIQGLTMGGVGRGTIIEYVESFASEDDGFEWFGGTVDAKYLVAAFNSDDAFDWDEGYRGRGQFWFAIQDEEDSEEGFGRGMELDGAIGDERGTPFGGATLSNITILGAGSTLRNASNPGDGSQLIILRDNSGGKFYNSIFGQHHNIALTIEDVSGENEFDSRTRLEQGDIVFENNLWYDFGAGNQLNQFAPQDFVQAYLSDASRNNRIAPLGLRGTSRVPDGGLDPRPTAESLANSGAKELDDNFFIKVPFLGAFGTQNWMKGWTALDQLGYLSDIEAKGEIRISNADLPVGQDFFWTSNNTYILNDMVFVKPGSRLFIEPGTVIKGELGRGNDATGLVITRGAQIFAEGTSNNPIIFTSVVDELNGNLGSADRGLWGGVVVLGAARTNNPSEGGLRLIEGVNEIANPVIYAEYGGQNDDDNSGILRYVSIRHTGINVGDVAGNEIQGLTMGGVGRGTIIEYVESFASEDDGFEWFGGTVDAKYLVAAFNSDDAFDWDEGYRGRGQFWFAIQDEEDSEEGFGRGMELDGAIGDERGTPFGGATLSNITILGAGSTLRNASNPGDGSQLIILRDNSGGKFYNSIFGQHHNIALTIEDVSGENEFDSRTRLEQGDIVFENNLWYDFGAGNQLNQFAPQDFVQAYLSDASRNNRIAPLGLRGTSRVPDGGLDPRPDENSPAWTPSQVMDDPYFERTTFIGAFGSRNWMFGWTALYDLGYLDRNKVFTSIDDIKVDIPTQLALNQNYPNPFNPTTVISFTLTRSESVRLSVYDMTGRLITTLVDGLQPAGVNNVSFNASGLASGIYIYRLETPTASVTKRMTLLK